MQCSRLRRSPNWISTASFRAATAYLANRFSVRAFRSTPLEWDERKTRPESDVDVGDLLSKPTWSVASLLPPKDRGPDQSAVSSKQLRHLLYLSALPPPKDDQEEARMLETLSAQLHFVKEIQKVDTSGVEPFRGLRDETARGEQEAELGLTAMQSALAREEIRGKHHRRIRRKRAGKPPKDEAIDVLATAERKIGRYFIVEGGQHC